MVKGKGILKVCISSVGLQLDVTKRSGIQAIKARFEPNKQRIRTDQNLFGWNMEIISAFEIVQVVAKAAMGAWRHVLRTWLLGERRGRASSTLVRRI